MEGIETKLQNAIRLLHGAAIELERDNKDNAKRGIKTATERLLTLQRELEAEMEGREADDTQLVYHAGVIVVVPVEPEANRYPTGSDVRISGWQV